MDIVRTQRWVMSSLTLTVAFMWAGGMVLGAIYVIEPSRPGARIGILVMTVVICLAAIVGVRLINQLSYLTPWLLTAFVPTVIGAWVLWG